MNKNMAGILSAAAVLTMLAGCTAYDRTKDQFVQPVVKDVKKGMSRAQVYEEVNHLILLKNPGGKWIKRDLMG